MDVARTDIGGLVTIDQARAMDTLPPLWCLGEVPNGDECGSEVWATALHSDKRAAAFAAHHKPGCDAGSERSKDALGDAGHSSAQGPLALRWTMKLGLAEPSQGPDGRHQPNPKAPGTLTRRQRTDPDKQQLDASSQRSFSTLLVDLVAGILPANLELVLGAKPPIAAADIIVHATKASTKKHLDSHLIVWGKVKRCVPTQWGSLMIGLYNAADDVAILVDNETLRQLHIEEPEQILERDVIAYGKYVVPAKSRRPHIRVQQLAIAFNPRVQRRLHS